MTGKPVNRSGERKTSKGDKETMMKGRGETTVHRKADRRKSVVGEETEMDGRVVLPCLLFCSTQARSLLVLGSNAIANLTH
jgi:hypothetical protein